MSYKESYGVHNNGCGHDYSLSRNPYGCSPRAVEAARETLGRASLYPHLEHALKEEIAAAHGVPSGNIMLAAGSIQAIDLLADVLLAPGDKVVASELTFEEFLYSAARKSPHVVRAPMAADFGLDLDAFAGLCDGACVAYVVNPNNPTGRTADAGEISSLAARLQDGYLIVDEANIEFDPRARSCLEYFRPDGNIIVARTFSKAYGLAGLRVGYAVVPGAVIEKFEAGYPPYKCAEAALAAACEALRDQEFLRSSVAKVRLEYARFAGALDRMGLAYVPSDVHTVLLRRPAGFATLNSFVRFLNSYDVEVVRADKADGVRVVVARAEDMDFLAGVLEKACNPGAAGL
ncbi:MAG: histidinol-phosphate aminotransferase family protein [Rickettsiales bacterium]|jgi:histidinol-phosphate aminotransferase|nr:histidinol-phosphate aminotransferase family protein [Rickettsiales bacterium]